MAQAQAQVNAAVAGATSCQTDGDCVLVETPCLVNDPCGFTFWAVNRTSEAAVAHQFSVTNAEVCGDCSPTSTGLIDPSCPSDSSSLFAPGSECDAGTCTVVGIPPDAGPPGAFEWACGGFCDSTGTTVGFAQFCEVSQVTRACPGWPGYVVVADGGVCLPKSTYTASCNTDQDCGLGEACDQSGAGCVSSCVAAVSPASCDAGCVLTSNNHACDVCWCPDGCPAADAG